MEALKLHISHNLNQNMTSLLKEHSIITITDSMSRIEYANANFCEIFERNTNHIIGETLELFKSHLHSGELYKELWRTIKMGRKWSGVLTDTTASGKTIWLDTTIMPIEDHEDHIVKYFAIYKDITENYTKNIELQEQKNTQDNFLKSMPLHMFSVTKHGKILNVNKAYLGLEVNELKGTYIYDYLNPEVFEVFKKNIDAIYLNKTSLQFETFDFDVEGRKKHSVVSISPTFNDYRGIESVIVTIQEVAKQITIVDNNRERETNYKSIYKSINVGIIIVADHKGNITEWNKGAELAFGYSELEILGCQLSVLITKNQRNQNIKELLKAVKELKNDKKNDIIEMSCLRKNGEEFPVEFALSSLNVNGQNFYCAMMLDITKRKALQNKLKQKTKDLELFLYRSAHDLRAPFSSAQGLLNLLKEEEAKDEISLLTEMLSTTINNGKALVDNLTQASIVTTKKIQPKKIDFNAVINKVIKNLSVSKNFKHFKFNIEVTNGYEFGSKPELISSMLQNLIQNALKHSYEATKDYQPIVDVSVKLLQKKALIKVCDNGQGVTKRRIKKIFDLYYRANNQNVLGNGLGLYIVKNIVEDLNGKISVESNINKGTCFEIELPNLQINY